MPTAAEKEMVVDGKTVDDVFPDSRLASLARAACKGETPTVERLIQAGVNPNGQGFEGTTPLFWALRCESAPGVEALLKAGADPNYRFPGEQGFTAVFAASGMKNPVFLKLMLQYRGDPNTGRQDSDWTALKAALYRGMDGDGWENYYALLDAGVDIDAYNRGTIAEIAADLNQYDRVNELLERGYSHDLKHLAMIVADANLGALGPAQTAARLKTIEILETRGITVPATR